MSRNLRNEIIDHLRKKGHYEPEVDDILIDILIKNVKYAEQLEVILQDEGLMTDIPNGNGIITHKENPAFGTYIKCLENIHHCAAKLGIHRKDRIALKIMEEKTKDDFDLDFGK